MEDAMKCAVIATAVLLGGALAAAGGPASAQNLGDIPANRLLDARCPRTDYLGPMVTGRCTDRNNLMIKSRIDVRRCAGFALTVDTAGHLRCRGGAMKRESKFRRAGPRRAYSTLGTKIAHKRAAT